LTRHDLENQYKSALLRSRIERLALRVKQLAKIQLQLAAAKRALELTEAEVERREAA
jgi:hypothetical protein